MFNSIPLPTRNHKLTWICVWLLLSISICCADGFDSDSDSSGSDSSSNSGSSSLGEDSDLLVDISLTQEETPLHQRALALLGVRIIHISHQTASYVSTDFETLIMEFPESERTLSRIQTIPNLTEAQKLHLSWIFLHHTLQYSLDSEANYDSVFNIYLELMQNAMKQLSGREKPLPPSDLALQHLLLFLAEFSEYFPYAKQLETTLSTLPTVAVQNTALIDILEMTITRTRPGNIPTALNSLILLWYKQIFLHYPASPLNPAVLNFIQTHFEQLYPTTNQTIDVILATIFNDSRLTNEEKMLKKWMYLYHFLNQQSRAFCTGAFRLLLIEIHSLTQETIETLKANYTKHSPTHPSERTLKKLLLLLEVFSPLLPDIKPILNELRTSGSLNSISCLTLLHNILAVVVLPLIDQNVEIFIPVRDQIQSLYTELDTFLREQKIVTDALVTHSISLLQSIVDIRHIFENAPSPNQATELTDHAFVNLLEQIDQLLSHLPQRVRTEFTTLTAEFRNTGKTDYSKKLTHLIHILGRIKWLYQNDGIIDNPLASKITSIIQQFLDTHGRQQARQPESPTTPPASGARTPRGGSFIGRITAAVASALSTPPTTPPSTPKGSRIERPAAPSPTPQSPRTPAAVTPESPRVESQGEPLRQATASPSQPAEPAARAPQLPGATSMPAAFSLLSLDREPGPIQKTADIVSSHRPRTASALAGQTTTHPTPSSGLASPRTDGTGLLSPRSGSVIRRRPNTGELPPGEAAIRSPRGSFLASPRPQNTTAEGTPTPTNTIAEETPTPPFRLTLPAHVLNQVAGYGAGSSRSTH